jgi:hypothetical protein
MSWLSVLCCSPRLPKGCPSLRCEDGVVVMQAHQSSGIALAWITRMLADGALQLVIPKVECPAVIMAVHCPGLCGCRV